VLRDSEYSQSLIIPKRTLPSLVDSPLHRSGEGPGVRPLSYGSGVNVKFENVAEPAVLASVETRSATSKVTV
jgi:hypothetical protein